MPTYDLVVAGGGPAGSAAAWRAARAGARVLLCDKARFPRDKPCGDGLTPRAVRSIADLGLGPDLERFNRIDELRVHGGGRTLDFRWPASEAFPDHGYVIARTDLDELMLRHAERAGVEVREGVQVTAPLDGDGRVRGVVARADGSVEEITAGGVIAADGASSRLARALDMVRDPGRPMGIAVRAHFPSSRPVVDDGVIESYLELREGDQQLPGYGWVFPMGGQRINVGVGILSTYRHWQKVNTARLMGAFLDGLPASWEAPNLDELRSEGELKGWRLPMGLCVREPWRPGILAVGDAAGAVNPFNGEGISEAVESGVAGAEVLLESLDGRGPDDLSAYPERLEAMWGPYYRLGRTFVRAIGEPRVMRAATVVGMRIPPVMSFAFKVLANLYRQRGGSVGDATMRGMLRLADRIRVG